MGVPEGLVAMQVRIHGFRRADRRHVCINIELQEGSDAALSLPSLAKLYRCKEVCFGVFFQVRRVFLMLSEVSSSTTEAYSNHYFPIMLFLTSIKSSLLLSSLNC